MPSMRQMLAPARPGRFFPRCAKIPTFGRAAFPGRFQASHGTAGSSTRSKTDNASARLKASRPRGASAAKRAAAFVPRFNSFHATRTHPPLPPPPAPGSEVAQSRGITNRLRPPMQARV